jgi:electron transfer flavoprotein alpha/beta subunit
MHYVICIKQVPDTAEVKIDPETNTLTKPAWYPYRTPMTL